MMNKSELQVHTCAILAIVNERDVSDVQIQQHDNMRKVVEEYKPDRATYYPQTFAFGKLHLYWNDGRVMVFHRDYREPLKLILEVPPSKAAPKTTKAAPKKKVVKKSKRKARA